MLQSDERPGQKVLTREVTKDVIAEARFGQAAAQPASNQDQIYGR
ncbi:MAG TPA: hypothetical protein VHZ07_27800 [Bryobacteraceae bacterium]|jgi:hypothetical protein|nr:hypothetical protein [Bryobacteraceae bacterium]